MLFLDGHGSHLSMRFLDWCQEHKILIACYPPHSTHRLQPLDISCFAPSSTYYSQDLDDLIRQSEGHTSIKNRDFFSIFWPAFQQAFRKEVIESAWSRTGIWPFNPEAVLKAFPEQHLSPEQSRSSEKRGSSGPPSGYNTPSSTKKIRRSVNAVTASTTPRTSRRVKHLGRALLRTSAELTIARLDKMQLTESLAREKRQKKRPKKLLEQLRGDEHTDTLFLSPSKIQKARDLQPAESSRKSKINKTNWIGRRRKSRRRLKRK